MHKFVTLDCLVDSSDNVPTSRQARPLTPPALAPVSCKLDILTSLQQLDFQFHRPTSLTNLIRECNVAEGQTLLMFWGCHRSESKATMSMCASSCSSLHLQSSGQSGATVKERDTRHTSQQTDISCRHSSGVLPSQLTSSPASSVLQQAGPGARSTSLLGSVCALLRTKQGSDTKSERSENICRICFGGESGERLVRPCSCRGTIAGVHRSCLERWLLQATTSYCELCRHHYVVTRSHKWSWLRSVVEWLRSGRGRALAADAWRGAALGAASVLGTARALQACDRVLQAGARRGGPAALVANLASSLVIGVVGALNGLLTTWLLLKLQEHQLSWQNWRDGTLHVHVTLPDEPLSPVPAPATATGSPATPEAASPAPPAP